MSEVRWIELASREAEAAFFWYFDRNREAARDFSAALGEAEDRLREGPERWPLVKNPIRKVVLVGFP